MCAGKTCKKLLALLAFAVALLMFVPLTVQADEVDDLLSAGNHVEGQAVVGFLTNDEVLTAQSGLPYAIELLTDVSASSVQSPEPSSELLLTAQASQRVDIVLVTSDELTTEELLRALADDPRVVFAEPNYVYELAWDEDDAAELSEQVPEEVLLTTGSEEEPQVETGQDIVSDTDVDVDALTPEPEEPVVPEAMDEEAEAPVASEADVPESETPDPETTEVDVPESEIPDSEASADPEPTLSAAAATDGPVGDLTPLVWGNWMTDQTAHCAGAAANPSINVPAYGSDQVGANMDKQIVVALLDTGVDYTNPDLTNVLYQFSSDEQAALGCSKWGYNALDRGRNGNVIDEGSIAMGHGTHTAGTIGASWDGQGMSGVASNVKIVSITLADANGVESLADAVGAFDFVNRFNEQASEENRIKITSNSWSEYMSSRALNAVVRELGDTWGIVSFFSSGNDGKNNDYFEKTPSSMAANPYAIIVANTTAAETLAENSEYGEATVDLGAPGSSILSTMPVDQRFYYPDGTRETNLLYVGFDGKDDATLTISQIDAEGSAHEVSGEVVSDFHLYGTKCLKLDIDPSYVVGHRTWLKSSEEYKIRLDLKLDESIAKKFDGAEGLHFGVGSSFEDGAAGFLASVTTNATTKSVDDPYGISAEDGCWGVNDFFLTHDYITGDETATRPDGDILSITITFCMVPGCSTVYLDSLGVGTQTLPYRFASGTSMATPQVAGAAAVLASQGYEGKELASLVRSKVRIPDSGALPLKTGGIFDFNVAGSPDGDEGEAVAPVIDGVQVEGTTVTITGSNFGSDPGSVELSRYIVGQGADENTLVAMASKSATITSWSDEEVILATDEPFVGIMRTVLTNAGGKYDTRYVFVSKGETVYEQDLPLDTSPGDPYVYEEQGDWETKGPLVGLGCKLYYLPAYEGHRDAPSAYRRVLCFDLKTQTWSELSDLPEWLQGVSAVMHEGKIVVEGATMYVESDEPRDAFPEGMSAEERVYVYDPATGAWSEACSEGMVVGQTIINDEGQLKLAGGEVQDPAQPYNPFATLGVPMMTYDLATGAGEELCDLPSKQVNPQAAAKDGTILLYDAAGLKVTLVQGGQATELENALPKFFLAKEGESETGGWGDVNSYGKRAVLAPTTEGFVLVGPPAADGSSDTYVLRDGADAFESYEKRSSDDRVYSQAACTYRGRLFVIGSAWFEPEQRFFRATAMDVPEYPGDIPCDEPTPEPEPTPTPTPVTPQPSGTLPKTGDPTIVVTTILAAGFALLSLGLSLRKSR